MAKVTEVIDGADQQEEMQNDASTGNNQHAADGAQAKETESNSDASGMAQQQETLVVTIGDQEPEEEDENLNFKQLRESHRERTKELREVKRKLEAVQGAVQSDTGLPAKPTLESCDYDTAKLESELEAYTTKKLDLEAKAKTQQEAKHREDEAWQAKLNGYGKAKDSFKARAPDFDEAEATVQDALSQVQQGIMVKGAKDAPLLVYALHKNPAKLKELAAITDHVEFTWQIAQLEAQLKVSTRQAHQPEARVSGTVAVGNAGADQMLEKLRADAARTGDMSKVHAYRRQIKEKQRKAVA